MISQALCLQDKSSFFQIRSFEINSRRFRRYFEVDDFLNIREN
jgi:hypothetical protein